MEELISYYKNLLIIQYHDRPKAQATIELFTYLIYANFILMQIQNAFDVDTAEGNQLDIIGRWVGVDRVYDGRLIFTKPLFSYPGWNDSTDAMQRGFLTYDNYEDADGGTLTYKDVASSVNELSDEHYRLLIKLKIIKNSITHTCKNIDDAIWNIFNGQVYTTWDNNMTLTYHHTTDLNIVIQVAGIKGMLPCPTGIFLKTEAYTPSST